MGDEEQIIHEIRARHIALVRLLGSVHDPAYRIPTIVLQSCDCINTVMKLHGYKLSNTESNVALGYDGDRGLNMSLWEKI